MRSQSVLLPSLRNVMLAAVLPEAIRTQASKHVAENLFSDVRYIVLVVCLASPACLRVPVFPYSRVNSRRHGSSSLPQREHNFAAL